MHGCIDSGATRDNLYALFVTIGSQKSMMAEFKRHVLYRYLSLLTGWQPPFEITIVKSESIVIITIHTPVLENMWNTHENCVAI